MDLPPLLNMMLAGSLSSTRMPDKNSYNGAKQTLKNSLHFGKVVLCLSTHFSMRHVAQVMYFILEVWMCGYFKCFSVSYHKNENSKTGYF